MRHLRPTNGTGQTRWTSRTRHDGRQQAKALAGLPMFAGCRPAQLRRIDGLLCEHRVAAGRIIVHEGRPADQMVLVVSGEARVSWNGTTLGIAEPGICYGGAELRQRAPYRVTITAATDLTIRVAGARELSALLVVAPEVQFLRSPVIRLPLPDRPERTTPPVPARPGRVLAAVMFTDIVDSTSTLVSLGDGAWHSLLDEHDAIVEREVLRFGGEVVKHLGDGALARFECADRAIGCALAVREAIRALGIEVRVGLHVGEVELRGTDITGITVHVANRICDAAGPGNVLASRTLADLVAGSEHVFEDVGRHQLKDVDGEWPLFAVVA
jgi:class 3 adenylate cyclase